MDIIEKTKQILIEDQMDIQVKNVNDKWVFDIIDVNSNRKDLNFNFLWGKNFPVNYVDINGKVEKLKEYKSKEKALQVGIYYYTFIKEVLMKPRFSKYI